MRIQAGQPVRPYAMHRILAGNSVRIEITSLNFDSELEAPQSLRYRIDNLTDKVMVVDWTDIGSPGTTSTLTIAGSVNQLYSNWRDVQLNQVTFEATYADSTTDNSLGCYEVARIYQGQVA